MTDIYPAATLVLVRDTPKSDPGNRLEVLLLRRSGSASFGAGFWVFPGGHIDEGDYNDDADDLEKAARRAAVRETLEEINVVVNERDIISFSHWTAPPGTTKRFATWFFISSIDAGTLITVDGSEIDESQWYTLQEALNLHESNTIKLMPPTFVTLTELATCSNVAEALAMYQQRPMRRYEPKLLKTDNGFTALYNGDAGYESGDINIAGARHRVTAVNNKAWRLEKTND